MIPKEKGNLTEKNMTIKEVAFSEGVATRLIALSKEWEQENSCYGYRGNNSEDFKDKRIFVAAEGDLIFGYLLGHNAQAEKDTSIYKAGTEYFKSTSCT